MTSPDYESKTKLIGPFDVCYRVPTFYFFPLKTHQMFSLPIMTEILHRKSNYYCDVIFSKSCVLKCFQSTLKRKVSVFQFLRFGERLRKEDILRYLACCVVLCCVGLRHIADLSFMSHCRAIIVVAQNESVLVIRTSNTFSIKGVT